MSELIVNTIELRRHPMHSYHIQKVAAGAASVLGCPSLASSAADNGI